MDTKYSVQDYINDIVFIILLIWTAFTTFLLFGPTVAVFQIKEHTHVAVVHMENNNTEFQKELNLLVKRYTEKD